MELSVLDIKGKDTGRKVTLSDSIFAIEPSEHAVYLDIKLYLANQRQGTHKAKERSDVAGSRKKLKKQKGTGGARAGDIKNPLFRGGGRVFGPRPRTYGFKLNKKVKNLAKKSVLTNHAAENNISVVEELNFDAPKTKAMIELTNNMKVADKKVLVVVPELNKNVYLSSRNLKGVKVVTVDDLNSYDVLNSNKVVLVESSVEKIENLLN